MTKVKVKKLRADAILPTYGTEYSAGADLYALPGEKIEIPLIKPFLFTQVFLWKFPRDMQGLYLQEADSLQKEVLLPPIRLVL